MKKKKIGILSMHRVVNYGSFLQAYALKKIIENLCECEVFFVDIKKGVSLYPKDSNKIIKLLRILKYLFTGQFIKKLRIKNYNFYLKNQFENEFFKLLGQIDGSDSSFYDCVVIGSDEVFNCCQRSEWGFTTQLYGDIPNAKKIISYAASFGRTEFSDLEKFGLKISIADNLRKLSAISVRDENSYNIVKELINIDPEKNLDPVLIYGYQNEINSCKEFNVNENFLLVYSYNGRISSTKEINTIKKFAIKNNLKIYTIFCTYSWADKCVLPETPFDVLKVFQKAAYVLSDTFHGTIFSIITHRKFGTLVRSSASNKINSLLNVLKLDNHIISDLNRFEEILVQNINYQDVEQILCKERVKTEKYLRNNI